MKKNFIKGIIAFGIVALLAIGMLVAYNSLKPETAKGSKEVFVEVVMPDAETKDFTLRTDAEYLRQALEEQDLIKGTEGDYGLFITEVNGYVANDANQEWWCITKDGEDVFTGVDETPIADGDHFEITLTVGY